VRVAGNGGGRSLLFNTHLDVVTHSQGQGHPFEPKVLGHVVGIKLSPIARSVATQKLDRRLIGAGQSVQSAGRRNDLTERK